MDKYSFESRVRYSECDETARLSLVSMIDYLQDCSTFQSSELGEAFGSLAARDLAWVLAAWRIEVDALPALGDRIRVSTWCYEMTRAHALRCFSIEDERGRTLVRADSQWLMFDAGRGRATRVPDDQHVYCSDAARLDMGPLDRHLRVAGTGTRLEPVRVQPHNLDTNRHVNNAQYVMFAAEALGESVLSRSRGCVQVLYRKMAHLDDLIVPVAYPCKRGWDVELTDGRDGVYALVRFQAPAGHETPDTREELA